MESTSLACLRGRRVGMAHLTTIAVLSACLVLSGHLPGGGADDTVAHPEASTAHTDTHPYDSLDGYAAHIAAAQALSRLGEVIDARRWLDSVPAANRGWEWSHLVAALDESIETIDAKSGNLLALTISPDGKRMATGTEHGLIQLWSTSGGTLEGTLSGHTGAVRSVRFSSDGSRLVSASNDHTVRVWDVAKRDDSVV